MLIVRLEANLHFGLVLELKVANSSASSPAEVYVCGLFVQTVEEQRAQQCSGQRGLCDDGQRWAAE